jgi:hypothetical protein
MGPERERVPEQVTGHGADEDDAERAALVRWTVSHDCPIVVDAVGQGKSCPVIAAQLLGTRQPRV